MISVEEAQKKIKRCVPKPQVETLLLEKALGRVLAESVRAPIALPVADNSAMDGFVVRARDLLLASATKPIALKIKGVIKAGDRRQRVLKSGEALSIMTGAFVPQGGDSVIAKEQAVVQGSQLIVHAPVVKGKHIRFCGEEVKKGRSVVPKSTVLHPGAIGFLATLGVRKVKVYRQPRVGVIATGSELVEPGKKLRFGQIYESNSWMVRAALLDMGIEPAVVLKVQDNPKQISRALKRILTRCDVLIVMGGVSVGDYDYVKETLQELGVQTVFWRVRQKPGKPLYFGKKKEKLVFGLPGNPASVLTCFYEYVYPALRKFSGFGNLSLIRLPATVQGVVKGDEKRSLFLKSKVIQNNGKREVRVLSRQGSHMLSSFLEANAFLALEPSKKMIKKGQSVNVDQFPYARDV